MYIDIDRQKDLLHSSLLAHLFLTYRILLHLLLLPRVGLLLLCLLLGLHFLLRLLHGSLCVRVCMCVRVCCMCVCVLVRVFLLVCE